MYVDEINDTLMDDHAPTTPIGDDIDLVVRPDGDASETSASR